MEFFAQVFKKFTELTKIPVNPQINIFAEPPIYLEVTSHMVGGVQFFNVVLVTGELVTILVNSGTQKELETAIFLFGLGFSIGETSAEIEHNKMFVCLN